MRTKRYGPTLCITPFTAELVPRQALLQERPGVALAGSHMVPTVQVKFVKFVSCSGPIAQSCQVCPPRSVMSWPRGQNCQVSQWWEL